jgi:hypothetical protein
MATTQVGSSSKNSIIAPPPQLTRRNHIFLRVDASFLARSSPTRVTDAKSSLNLPTDGFPSDGASRQQTILALSMPSGRRPPHQIKCLAPADNVAKGQRAGIQGEKAVREGVRTSLRRDCRRQWAASPRSESWPVVRHAFGLACKRPGSQLSCIIVI